MQTEEKIGPSIQEKIKGVELELSNQEPIRTGYIFRGWSTTENATEVEYEKGAKYVLDENTTLYAIWIPKTVKVTFMRNTDINDITSATQIFTYGVLEQKFSEKGWSKTGYTLIGWNEDKTSSTGHYSLTSEVSNNWINTNSPEVTIYGIWTANTYTVKYNKGDASSGTLPTNQTATYDANIILGTNNMVKNTTTDGYKITYNQGTATSGTLPTAQTQTISYTANGWATSSNGLRAYTSGQTFKYTLTSELNLYPSWTVTRNAVKLSTNSMTKSNTNLGVVTFNYNGSGAANTTSTAYTKYTANGWTTTSGSTTRNYTNGQSITPTAAMTLYPCFSQTKVSATFPTPTRTGYKFEGWYTASTGGTKVTSYTGTTNVTYYAHWTANTYAVKYNKGDASSGTLPTNQTATYDANITLGTNSMVKNTTTNGYKITYNQGTATSGTLPTAQTQTISYTANGWATSSNGLRAYTSGQTFKYTLTSELNLYPSWTVTRNAVKLSTNSMTKSNTNLGVVTFNLNGGNISGSTTNPTSTAYTKYTANGWTTTSGSATRNYTNGQSITPTAAMTLYPCFSQTKVSATFPSPTRTGYTFAGWYTATSGGTKVTSYTGATNVTYYAHWTANTYAVKYNKGDASSGTLPTNQTATYNANITLGTNSMVKNTTTNGYKITYNKGTATSGTLPTAQTQTISYTANGWATSSNGTRAYTNGQTFKYTLTSELNLYPSWTVTRNAVKLSTNSMTKSNTNLGVVTFNYNGSGAANTTSTAYTKYTANGWTTTSGSTTRNYTNGQSITPTAAMTLYPCFSQTKVSATFPTPTRTGYKFEGWYTAASGGTKVTSYTGTTNVTYYAHWTAEANISATNGYSISLSSSGGSSSHQSTSNISGIPEGWEIYYSISVEVRDASGDFGFLDSNSEWIVKITSKTDNKTGYFTSTGGDIELRAVGAGSPYGHTIRATVSITKIVKPDGTEFPLSSITK